MNEENTPQNFPAAENETAAAPEEQAVILPPQNDQQESGILPPRERPQENHSPQKPDKSLIAGVVIVALLLLYAFVQRYMEQISTIAPNIIMGALTLGSAYLIIRYFRQIKKAVALARTGNRIMAKKAAYSAFLPAITSANLAVYNFINSDFAQNNFHTAKNSVQMVRTWLMTVSDKGIYIYYGAIVILVLLLNGVFVKNFRRVTRVARIIR